VVQTTVNLSPGAWVQLSGTGGVDGVYSVTSVSTDSVVLLGLPNFLNTGASGGTLTSVVNGTINLNAGKSVNVPTDIPLQLGSAQIVSNFEDISIIAGNIKLFDPIPTIISVNSSDKGILLGDSFLGMIQSTRSLTWMTSAVVTESGGKKTVSGTLGTFVAAVVNVNQINGTPNLTLKANDIYFDCGNFVIPNAIVGQTGGISSSGSSLILSSNGNITLQPATDVVIPPNNPLTFTGSASFTGTATGLVIESRTINPISFIGDLFLPSPYKFYFGGSVNSTVYGDSVSTHVTSGGNLYLKPANSVVIHDNVWLQIGDTPNSGLKGTAGNLTIGSVVTNFPSVSELSFGTTSTVSNTPLNFAIQSSLPIQLSSNAINIVASDVTVPVSTPILFGKNSTIQESTDSALHVTNTGSGVIISNTLIVNGALIVNGPSSNITSTVTVITDPILTLGLGGTGVQDVKDRGIQFYHDSGTKLGFMGFSQTQDLFCLLSDGVNVSETITPTTYGDLIINTLHANGLTGTPDLTLVASDIFLTASSKIIIPTRTPLTFGEQSNIQGTSVSMELNSSSVSISQGSLSIGQTRLTLTDVNSFHMQNVQNIYLDAIVHIQSSLIFGVSQTSIAVDNQTDDLRISSSSNVIMFGDVKFHDAIVSGNSQMIWDLSFPGGQILWWNVLPNSELTVTIMGNIRGATWMGSTITLDHGGTGNSGGWSPGSVVWVDTTGTFLNNATDFVYKNGCLGIGTSSPTQPLTVTGNIGLNGSMLFSGFGIGVDISGLSFTAGQVPAVTILPSGDVTISGSASLNGDLNLSGAVRWSQTSGSISSRAGVGIVIDSNLVTVDAPLLLNGHAVSFTEMDSSISGVQGGILRIESDFVTEFTAPHVLIENRLCFHHDVSSNCLSYATFSGGILQMTNETGDISLNPASRVVIGDQKSILFGNGGSIVGIGADLCFSSNHDINLMSTNVRVNGSLSFGSSTVLSQSLTNFMLSSVTDLDLSAPRVSIPDSVSFVYGNNTNKIIGIDDTLYIYGESVNVQSNNVTISGNLTVSKKTTFTIESETSFDSGVITLGGKNRLDVINLAVWFVNQTIVTVSRVTGLLPGDSVELLNTVPNIDGTYTVITAPTSTSFVVNVVFPGSNETVSGNAETALISDPGTDLGVVGNWYTGHTSDTTGAREAFFGFDRSTTRWTFIPVSTNVNNVFSGTPGDIEIGNVYATGLSATNLLSTLQTNGNLVSGSNFSISGGTIDNVVIGAVTPTMGSFSYLTIKAGMTTMFTGVVTNFNADYVDGHHAGDFLFRDGTAPLLNDWNAGGHRITSMGLSDTTLTAGSIVIAGSLGALGGVTNFTFQNNTLSVPRIGSFGLTGTINCNGNRLIDGTIYACDLSLTSSNVFDASLGRVIFASGQIPGPVISGGIANIDISGTATFVIDGIYTTDYLANTILKADADQTVTHLVVPEGTFIGRPVGGVISAMTIAEVASALNVVNSGVYLADSILKADTAGISIPLVIPENTIVGRMVGGVITALRVDQIQSMLEISAVSPNTILAGGALLRQGHLFPGGGDMTGGTMTGLMFTSYERVSVLTGQTLQLNVNLETSYVNVLYNRTSGAMAYCNLGAGLADGHRKIILLSTIAERAILQVTCSFVAPGTPNPFAFMFWVSGQSAMLQWDNVLRRWIIVGSGCQVVTSDDLRDPNFVTTLIR
jgi:hypothetical protein